MISFELYGREKGYIFELYEGENGYIFEPYGRE
jgi:hypothetical protein